MIILLLSVSTEILVLSIEIVNTRLFFNNLKRIRVYLFKYETPVLKNLITFDIHIKN